MNKIKLFNNEIEMGLQIIIILEAVYPKSFDIKMLNYYDYFILHTHDLGGKKSLHADIPNRFGELDIKHKLIRRSLQLMIAKGLVSINMDNGIEYLANQQTKLFLENLKEEYIEQLKINSRWVHKKFKDYSYEDIKQYVLDNKEKWGTENPFCTIGLTNE